VLTVVSPFVIQVSDGNFGFSNAQFGFNITGPTGQRVVVEASQNLQQWTPLWTNTLGNGSSYFSDPGPSNFLWRFYRVRAQ
jgi:hypothetical protein